MPRPTRAPGQVVTSADIPAGSTFVRIAALVCPGTDGGFVLADDLSSGSLDRRPNGCRAAVTGAVAVRAETLSPDGLSVTTVTAASDDRGVVSFAIPIGQRATTVRLTAISSAGEATTTMMLFTGQTRSLTLIVPDPDGAAGMTSGSTVAGEDGQFAAGGAELAEPSSTSSGGWFAVAGLLLAALAMAIPSLRRRL